MDAQTAVLSRKLAEAKMALQEIKDARAPFLGGAEITGDWSEREEVLLRAIYELEGELTALKTRPQT